MIHGTYTVKRVIETSKCRIQGGGTAYLDQKYKIHSVALMPDLSYGTPQVLPETIDSSMFVNGSLTPIKFPTTINCQNYLTTTYKGTQPKDSNFTLICREGNPNSRSFQ